jgi:uncharacterized membrane protein YqhA
MNKLHKFFLNLRFAMLFASLGSLIGAILMFWIGCLKIFQASVFAFTFGNIDGRAVIASLMGATDSFLFGVVLMVFSYAITFGFVVDLSRESMRRLPPWMRVGSIGELKRLLVQVILVYLVVDFATDVVEAGEEVTWVFLVVPIAVVTISAALRLLQESVRNQPTEDEDSGERDL